jgi:hypothetical protein
MNRKQFLLLLGLAVLIGAAGLIVYQRNHGAWESADTAIGGELLPGLSVNDVAQLDIQSGTNTLLLTRRDNVWCVPARGNYPANFSQISDLLLKIADLKIVQTESVGPSQLGRLDLLPPTSAANAGTLVEFQDQSGKTMASLLLGKKHQHQAAAGASPDGMDSGWPDGRYVISGTPADNRPNQVAVISDPLDSVQTQPASWLNKDFLSIDKPAAISVQFPVSTNNWKLTRTSETNDWQLADAGPEEKLDTTKISNVTTPFSSASFNDVAPLTADSSLTASNAVLTVNTFDGLSYVAKIGQAKDDNYPVSFSILTLPSAPASAADKVAKAAQYSHWVYYLPSYSIDEILKPRGQLLLAVTNAVPATASK